VHDIGDRAPLNIRVYAQAPDFVRTGAQNATDIGGGVRILSARGSNCELVQRAIKVNP
jgi:hypothetical protein